VSDVEGQLASGTRAIDALRATFPAGTMTGAPKVRAMEIIDELEPERRGAYAGAVGYIAADGRSMDLAITIRTCVIANGEVSVNAGAGIVADSVPEREWDETENTRDAYSDWPRPHGAARLGPNQVHIVITVRSPRLVRP
jgi:anthranilate synthase component 1